MALPGAPRPPFRPDRLPPTYVSFNLEVPVLRIVTVDLAHVLADFVSHPPSGLVGDAQLPLEFFGRNAMPRRGEQVQRVEPLLERRAGALKWRSDHRMNVIAATGAGIGRVILKACPPAELAALSAFDDIAMADQHQVRQTGVVVREKPHEVVDRESLFRHRAPHTLVDRDEGFVRQRDNCKDQRSKIRLGFFKTNPSNIEFDSGKFDTLNAVNFD